MMRFSSNGSVVNVLNHSSGFGLIGTSSNHPLYFYTNNSSKMSLSTNGYLTIGSASPSAPLAVYGPNNTGGFFDDGVSRLWIINSGGSSYLESGNSAWTSSVPMRFSGPGLVDTNFYFYGSLTTYGVIYATSGNSSQWNTAYSWGNHAGLYSLLSHTHNQLVGNNYILDGLEKPNNLIFGPGKLRYQMLWGGSTNLNATEQWVDTLWNSSYTGSDVKGSNLLIIGKTSDYIGFCRQLLS